VLRSGLRTTPDGTQAGSADHGDMLSGDRSNPRPIVVGVERSDRSRDALALARTLARAVGTRLILVAVYPVGSRSAVMPPHAHAAALAEEAQSILEWAARPLAGVKATLRSVPCTSVTRGLQQVAEEEDALAIVVGPSHRGTFGHVVPGSVGERLLHGAPCPVAVAPRGYWSDASPGIRRIGVGFVPTPEADEALCAATGIALRTGAAIRTLSVVDLPDGVTMGYTVGAGDPARTARDDLSASVTRTLADVTSPVDVSGEVVDGYADDELARLSDEVDLLVCGSRGRGAVGRVLLGSVAAGVMRKARCPVLIVPRGARDGFATLQPPVPAAA
jgi:nucleotide-binding universal stress UspA family protein